MADTFFCQVDGRAQADYCCTCAFPLPCICSQCSKDHCSKPGPHCLFPIALRQEVKSARELAKWQNRVQQLRVTYREFHTVLDSFRQAKEDIEAAYSGILHSPTALKDIHMAKLDEFASFYEERLNATMQDCYANSWKCSDFRPSSPFTDLVWRHSTGDIVLNMKLIYQFQTVSTSPLEQLMEVRWALPFPDFPTYPENSLILKAVLDSGEIVPVVVARNSTLEEIRGILIGKNKLGAEIEHFYREMERLGEDLTVEKCGLSNGSLLRVTSRIDIKVITPELTTFDVSRDFNTTVKELLDSFPVSSVSIPGEKWLLYREQKQENDITLLQCGIKSGSEVHIIIHYNLPFSISVSLPLEREITLKVDNSDTTVAEIKDKIWVLEGLIPDLYELIYIGKKLKDGLKIACYSLGNEAILTLLPCEMRKIKVRVKPWTGSVVTIELGIWETVEDLKRRLPAAWQFSDTESRLTYEGKEPKTGRYLASYQPPSLYTFTVLPRNLQLFVKLPSGKTVTLNVFHCDTVRSIKETLRDTQGIPEGMQQLILGRRQLLDELTVKESQVQANSTLHLLIRAPAAFEVSVQVEGSAVYRLYVVGTDTLASIRKKLGKETREELTGKRFVYNEQELEDEEVTVEMVGVTSTLYLQNVVEK